MPEHLSVEISFAFAALEVAFALTAPWTCLFGPSGSGKSTILRAIAGFERPASGRIAIGSQALLDAARGIDLPPHRRPIRLAAQQTWLFPGTVARNVSYGMNSAAQSIHLKSILKLTHLASLEDADVRTLSGGERQRVSIARALGAAAYGPAAPCVLLLDEPFTGMDASLRDEVALSLRNALHELKVPVLSVTHDIGEVFLLEADVLRLAPGGKIVQGPAGQVLANERARLRTLLGTQ